MPNIRFFLEINSMASHSRVSSNHHSNQELTRRIGFIKQYWSAGEQNSISSRIINE